MRGLANSPSSAGAGVGAEEEAASNSGVPSRGRATRASPHSKGRGGRVPDFPYPTSPDGPSQDDLLLLHPDRPVGGRVWAFRSFWKNLPVDSLVAGILEVGYKIPFFKTPRFSGIRQTPLAGQFANVLLDEVSALLQKQAVEPVLENESEGFYSTYFLVPKRTGDLRPIINLKPINGLIVSPSFKMETLASVVHGLRRNDWMASIDLKDAYFHVPIHPDSRKFLRFCIQGRCYQYRVLPFGLSTSPRVFTKFLAPIMASLRLQGIRIFPYLDDLLFTAESKPLLLEHLQIALRFLTQAGFIVNAKKSSLEPTQDLVFLGARLRTQEGWISLPPDKAEKVAQMVRSFQANQCYTARRWMQLLGVLAATIPMTKLARLRMRPIQWHFHSLWNRSRHSLEFPVRVSPEVHQHLRWWTSLTNLSCGLPLFRAPEQCVITTDASSLGWGGVLDRVRGLHRRTVQGQWTLSQQEWHINVKELMAVFLTLQRFQDTISNCQVLVRSDNTTACAYINKGGGTRSQTLCQLAIQMWDWCVSHGVDLRAVHVPGTLNVLADSLSRRQVDQREWSLHGQVAHKLFLLWGVPQVDLFATCHNNRVPQFCSLYQFPGALALDAFSVAWNNFRLVYAFPPLVLLAKVLHKVRSDRANVILIAPRWPMRAWYATLLDLLVDFPRALPLREDLLTQFGIPHPDPTRLQLMGWKLSGEPSEQRAFRARLLKQSFSPERPAPWQATMPNGAFLFAGAMRGNWIPILQL